MPNPSTLRTTTIDPVEIAKFERMAAEWWNPDGKFRPLHRFNPVRLGYIRDTVCGHFARDPKGGRPFAGLDILDIGCGGGLLSEPMVRLGGSVVGVDPVTQNIEVARLHAERGGLRIDYRAGNAEDLAAQDERFDVVLALEVVEHVADMDAFLVSCAALAKPGGLVILSTINRTLRAFGLAIVGAEYVLGWLPRGTHDYAKFVRPDELQDSLRAAGLDIVDRTGIRYDPFSGGWSRASDMSVNYIITAAKPGADNPAGRVVGEDGAA